MNYRIASARPLVSLLTAAGLAFALALSAAPAALAQAPAKPADKKSPAKPAAAQKPAAGAPAAAPGQAGAPAAEQPQLMYSSWVKVCGPASAEANATKICTTMKDARTEDGRPVIIIQVVEPEGSEKKTLRVVFPLGMSLQYGTRVIVDQNQPVTAPFAICFPIGCLADYEITASTIALMKKGQNLTLQAINMYNSPFNVSVPLSDFAKAYDGAPTDPKVVEEQNRKLQDALQKKAAEAQKKLESQQPAAAAAPADKK
jgi:invasion protein IalB